MSKEAIKLEMVDDEGENQAVRMFLALYGGACGVTAEQMRKHLKMAGFDGAWPEWANSNNGHLTKAGAQLWIRHLFALVEQPAPVQGWKLVPVEPTEDMWKAVNKLDDEMAAGSYDGKGCSIEQAWNCLLAAAPQPAQQEPFGYFKAEPFGWTDCAETDEGAVALYERPPAQRKPLTTKEIREWWASENDLEDCSMSKLDDFEQVVRAIEAAHNIKENT